MSHVVCPIKTRGRLWGLPTVVLLTVILAAQCQAEPSKPEQKPLDIIVVSATGCRFVERNSGRDYVPFGTNYYDPHTGWAPKLWKQFDAEKVQRHFEVMRSLGVNCARVFLTTGSFQPTADTLDEQALKKLDRFVDIAGKAGIRLILTGPDHWEGVPEYWRADRYAGENALRALELFWQVVGGRYKGNGTIFAWDLLNEPHIPWFEEQWRTRWNEWLKDKYNSWELLKNAWRDELGDTDKWGDVAVPQDKPDANNPRLRDWQLFREHLADEWVRRQAEAIRKADPTHLITVGYIQWTYPLLRYGNPGRYAAFNPHRQAKWCDFVTIHFYPTFGDPFASKENWQRNIDYLRAVLAYCHVGQPATADKPTTAGKPVVLGEYGWYGGGAPQHHPFLTEQQQADWLSGEIEASRGLADGWLSWPFADTPGSTDISLYAGLVKEDLSVKAWGRKFAEFTKDLSSLERTRPKLELPDFGRALTVDDAELKRMHEAFVRKIAESVGQSIAAESSKRN